MDISNLALRPWPATGCSGRGVALVLASTERSGASLLAHMLVPLGATLPLGNDAAPPSPALSRLNRRILDAFGRDPQDPRPMPPRWLASPRIGQFVTALAEQIEDSYGDAALVLLHDPALARLLPLYGEALDRLGLDMRVIHCVRHPAAMLHALQAAGRAQPWAAALSWIRATLEAERASRSHRRGWVSFESLVIDPDRAIGVLGRDLGFPWLAEVERLALDLLNFVHGAPHIAGEALDPSMPLLQDVWEAAHLAIDGDEAAALTGFDAARSKLAEFDLYAAQYERQLDFMRASSSWRLTAPLRFAGRTAHRLRAAAACFP